MNVFTGIGRLGRDAEVRYTNDGKPITSFAVAIEEGFGERKTTSWFDCVLFGERGPKIAEYIRKGDRIGITGSIRLDTFKNREGVEKSKIALRVSEVELLGDKRDGETRGGGPVQQRGEQPKAGRGQPQQQADQFDSDDIPFLSMRGRF